MPDMPQYAPWSEMGNEPDQPIYKPKKMLPEKFAKARAAFDELLAKAEREKNRDLN